MPVKGFLNHDQDIAINYNQYNQKYSFLSSHIIQDNDTLRSSRGQGIEEFYQ